LTPLSFYMLVKNSEKYLPTILSRIATVADEIILLDSGSQDATHVIAEKFHAQWHFRPFDHFRNQRTAALSLCRHSYVLFLDADEIPDETLIQQLQIHKQKGFTADAYCLQREWIVLGKRVHSIYPVCSPDFPVRLINKEKVSFAGSARVHEEYSGYQQALVLPGKITHYTFHSMAELQQKLNFYARIAAEDRAEKGKPFHRYQRIFNPPLAWLKWYLFKGGWRDGKVGLILANYAFRYTYLKHYHKIKQ
jgi:glycosyltransferase involved in cell wall biosynthesis